jgi:hypothetical protein
MTLAGPAWAIVPVTPSNILGVGLLAASCASGHGSGNGISITGAIDSGLIAAATSCAGQAPASAAGQALSNSIWATSPVTAGATASSSMGLLHLSSTMDTPGGSTSLFPAAIGQAGFGDTLTVSLQGQEGKAAFLLLDLQVHGVLDAGRNAGSSAFQVAVTKNNSLLSASNPGYERGSGNEIGTDRQIPAWKASSFPPPTGPLSEHQVINEVVTFSVPVTIGTSFEMVVLGLSLSATRSQSGASLSSSDFSQTVRWSGIHGLLLNGSPVAGYSVTSASGVDWTAAAAVPEPAPWMLFGAGALLLIRLRGTRLAG